MLHGHPQFENLPVRLDLIADAIARHNVDIVLLQEVPWTWRIGNATDYLAERSGFNHVFLRANGNRWAILFEEGEAILSRYPLKTAIGMELEPKAGFFENRVALHAVVESPFGDLDLFVTHLTNGRDSVNLGQAADLVDFVEETGGSAGIIAGDMNAVEVSSQLTLFNDKWLDAYRDANPDEPGHTCCVDDLQVHGEAMEKRIDYVFLYGVSKAGINVTEARAVLDKPFATDHGWQWASDHLGLLIELAFEGGS
jgi:endonuclease/exonuclease/phosphatase family metal-dependent hydrolase